MNDELGDYFFSNRKELTRVRQQVNKYNESKLFVPKVESGVACLSAQCKSKNTIFRSGVQTRSADEGSVGMVTCLVCGHEGEAIIFDN